MTQTPNTNQPPQGSPESFAATQEVGAEELAQGLHSAEPTVPMRKGQIASVFVAQITLYLAFVAPSAYSLAIRVQAIDPAGKNTILALAIGIPGVLALITNPLAGVLSDRTRSRFGRRRPWILLGTILGIVGSATIGLVASTPVLILGWAIAFIGYSITNIMILTYFGDRLPASQRGRVMGVNGAITQIGPVMGVVLAGVFSASPTLMFLVPGIVALAGGLFFIFVMKDPQFTAQLAPFELKKLLEGYWFNPRRFPNLGWVWMSKALIFLAIGFMSIYSVYLLSSRLHLNAGSIAAVVSTIGLVSVVTSIAGALLSGWLSDKFNTRKPFLIISAFVLAAGLVTVGTTASIIQFVVGSLVGAFALGIYGAVDQAVQLDVLPQEELQNGRFIAVLSLANQAPQAIGPFAAAGVLALALGNYSWVYFAAAAAAVLGALAIVPISIGRRALLDTTSVKVVNGAKR